MENAINVLIIDDDELDRKATIRALKQSNLVITYSEAATAKSGLRLLENEAVDVVLLDIRLPDADGLEVLSTIRTDHSMSIAVVMISRLEDERLADQAIESGAQDFLLKDEVTGRRLKRALLLAQHRNLIELALRTSHEQLHKIAKHDALTGLANRYTFEKALQSAVARHRRKNEPLAVMLLDLDQFKSINDSLGHDIGDAVLVEAAKRISQCARDSDFVARLGGDEFVIIAQDMQRSDQALLLADRIVDAFSSVIVCGVHTINISTSIGIAVTSRDGDESAAELLKCADIAMYRAKQDGRNQSHFFSEELQIAVHQRAQLEKELLYALDQEQFRLYYQPKFDARSNRLHGAEALIRWEHPDQGLLPPAAFLQIAEELGLMTEVGTWVLRTACRQLRDWQSRSLLNDHDLTIAVNLSPSQLQGGNFISLVKDTLLETEIDASSLELEITENTMITDPSGTAEILKGLAALGVKLSLDDFGTGYSSLQHLHLFPINILKVDRSFVSVIGNDKQAERLLSAIIHFGKKLDLDIVAEGIESVEHAQYCSEKGCDLLQGFHYAKPISAEEFEQRFLQPGNAA